MKKMLINKITVKNESEYEDVRKKLGLFTKEEMEERRNSEEYQKEIKRIKKIFEENPVRVSF